MLPIYIFRQPCCGNLATLIDLPFSKYLVTTPNGFLVLKNMVLGKKNGVCRLIIRIVRPVCLANIPILATILQKSGNPDNPTLF